MVWVTTMMRFRYTECTLRLHGCNADPMTYEIEGQSRAIIAMLFPMFLMYLNTQDADQFLTQQQRGYHGLDP